MKPRKSAKQVIEDYAEDILTRTGCPDRKAKLLVIETIAFRMGWHKLYNRLRFGPSFKQVYNPSQDRD